MKKLRVFTPALIGIMVGIWFFTISPSVPSDEPPVDGGHSPVQTTAKNSSQPAATNNVPVTEVELGLANKTAATTPQTVPKIGQQSLSATPHSKAVPLKAVPAGEKVYRALYKPKDQPAGQWYPTKIGAPAVWDKTVGSTDTVVAVIDTGFSLRHDELFDRWAANPGESGGKATNGKDDDGNGYIDDWRGWDFYHADNMPLAGTDSATGDGVSHGTAVAGLVGVAGNNGIGVVSLNWRTKILPLQVLNDHGAGVSSDVADAMHYAVDQGVDVISMSLGTDVPDSLIEAEVAYAQANGVLIVAASGNDGCDCLAYPANYPNVLAVGASTASDQRASFSSYGANLDVLAPGSGTMYSPVWSATSRDSYAKTLHGTSFATPIVSGLAAMLKGLDATFTPDDISGYIKDGADQLSITTLQQGSGRINAYASLILAKPTLPNNLPDTPTAPLYRLYKTGVRDRYTVLIDRREILRLQGYKYEIIRAITQSD